VGLFGDILKGIAGVALVAGGIIITGLSFGLAGPVGFALITAGIGVLSGLIAQSSLRDQDAKFRANRLSMLDPLPVIYGERLIGGIVVDYRLSGEDNKLLYIVLAVCHGSRDGSGIEGFGEIYFNGELVVDATGAPDMGFSGDGVEDRWNNKVRWGVAYGRADQPLHPALFFLSNTVPNFTGRWRDTASGAGIAYLIFELENDPETFRGVPVITVVVRGARVWDPRTDLFGYLNPAAISDPPATGEDIVPLGQGEQCNEFQALELIRGQLVWRTAPERVPISQLGLRPGDVYRYFVELHNTSGDTGDGVAARIDWFDASGRFVGGFESAPFRDASYVARQFDGNTIPDSASQAEVYEVNKGPFGCSGLECVRTEEICSKFRVLMSPVDEPDEQPPEDEPTLTLAAANPGQNPILQVYDLLLSPIYGAGLPLEEVDNLVAWIREVNHCDEVVEQPVIQEGGALGGTEAVARYRSNLIVDTEEPISTRITNVLSACHGSLFWESGKFRPFIRRAALSDGGLPSIAPTKETLIEINEEYVQSEVEFAFAGIKSSHGRQGANSVHSTYVFPFNNWAVETISWPQQDDPSQNPFLLEDNSIPGEMSIDLPAVTDPYQAVRLAAIILKELREADVIGVTVSERFLTYGVGSLLYVSHGIVNPAGWFWVMSVAYLQTGHIQYSLMRYNPEAYEEINLFEVKIPEAGIFPPTVGDVAPPTDLVTTCELTCPNNIPTLKARFAFTISASPNLDPDVTKSHPMRWRWEDDDGPLAGDAGEWKIQAYTAATQSGAVIASFILAGSQIEGATMRIEVAAVNLSNQGSDDLTDLDTNWQASALLFLQNCSGDVGQSMTFVDCDDLVEIASWGDKFREGDGFVIYYARNGTVRIALDVTGKIREDTRIKVYGSGTSGFTINEGTFLDDAVADEFEVDLDVGIPGTGNLETWAFWHFTPPVEQGATWHFRLCVDDCFVGSGATISCSDECSSIYPGIRVAANVQARNIAPIGAVDEHCVSGAGALAGFTYPNVSLTEAGLLPGDVISVSALGKVESGGQCAINPAEDFALVEDGLIGRDFFTSDPFLSGDWTVDSDPAEVSYDAANARITFDPSVDSHNLFMRWTSPGCTIAANPRSFSMWAAWEYTGGGPANYHPLILAIDRAGDEFGFAGAAYGVFSLQQYFFGPKFGIGTIIDGVALRYSPLQLSDDGPKAFGFRLEDDAFNNEVCAAGEDYVMAALGGQWLGGTFQRCVPEMDDGPNDTFWPVLSAYNNNASGGAPCHFYEMHAWRRVDIDVKNLPANTTVRFERDARVITTGLNVPADTKETSGLSGDVSFPIGEWGEPGWNRCILKDSGGVEFSRIEPSQGLYGGGELTYNPSAVSDCVSTFDVNFLNANGAILQTKQSAGTQNAVYAEMLIENITVPLGTVSLQIQHQKLGSDDCTNVCMKELVIAAGSQAVSGYIPPAVTEDNTTDDLPPGTATTTVTPDEQEQISESGENLIVLQRWAEENYTASDAESVGSGILDLAALGVAVGDYLSYAVEVRSATGADDLRARMDFYDAAGDVFFGFNGFNNSSSTFVLVGTGGVQVPSGAVSVRVFEENLDQTEAWDVRNRQLNKGKVSTSFLRSAFRPADEDQGTTGSDKLVDFLHATTVKIEVTAATTVTPINLTPGVPHRLVFIQDGTGGFAVSIAGVEWAGGEPAYTTTANTKTLVDLLLVQGTIYASMWGTGFAPGSVSVLPPTGGVALTGFAPLILSDVQPGTGVLQIQSFAPLVKAPFVSPALAALDLTTFAPTVKVGPSPPTGEITLTTFAPSVPTIRSPGLQTGMVVSTFAPTVYPAQKHPPTGGIDLETFAPIVSVTS
jgi:hypothetical protein